MFEQDVASLVRQPISNPHGRTGVTCPRNLQIWTGILQRSVSYPPLLMSEITAAFCERRLDSHEGWRLL
jgi:hypothetical protein